jgi:DDE superfamily endonuclease
VWRGDLVNFLNFHVHFTPTSASWLNLVERWFGLITSQAIRRGSFDSVKSLEKAIARYLADWNEKPRPFRWTNSAAAIKGSIRNVTAIYELDKRGKEYNTKSNCQMLWIAEHDQAASRRAAWFG